MYSGRDKIVKKKNEKTSETEDEVAKALFELENTQVEGGVEGIKKVKFTNAEYLTEGENKVLLIVVPFPLYIYVKKNYAAITNYLAGKFKVPVFIVAQRTILSKYGIKRYNSHREAQGISEETYESNINFSPWCFLGRYRKFFVVDLQIFPFEIVGRRLRIKTDGTQIHKIHLKEDDRKGVEGKLAGLALVYKKLTRKILSFEFVKTLLEEKRKKKKKEAKKQAPKVEKQPVEVKAA